VAVTPRTSVRVVEDPAVTLVEIAVGDEPVDWASIGFAVDDADTCQIGAVRMRLVGSARARGIVGWSLRGCALSGEATPDVTYPRTFQVDGLPTTAVDRAAEPDITPRPAARQHPNGVNRIDHMVVMTADLDRTTTALEALGIVARRTREAGQGRRQRFFRLGEVILEVVDPVDHAGDRPAAFWGLAFTVADIDATAAYLVGRLSEPRNAVQQGRRIATLRSGGEVSVPLAFMSPAERGAPGGTRQAPR
jgi:hypothetical protein